LVILPSCLPGDVSQIEFVSKANEQCKTPNRLAFKIAAYIHRELATFMVYLKLVANSIDTRTNLKFSHKAPT